MKTNIEPQPGQPFIWGWDDESIYFTPDGVMDGTPERQRRIQDEPELLAEILKLCQDYYGKQKP